MDVLQVYAKSVAPHQLLSTSPTQDTSMTAPIRSVPLARPAMDGAELAAIAEVLASGMLVQGPRVRALEEAFARRHRVGHAVAVNNCSAALHLALVALGVGPGDEVIVPAFTWVATANAVVYTGATPVFVDVNEATYNVEVARVIERLTHRTRAVIPVHLFGLPAEVPSLRAALPTNVRIVEDAACAAGAAINGNPVGTLGDLACFSFHPRKSITTGEGGIITTDDATLARRLRVLRNHGLTEGTPGDASLPLHVMADVEALGYNYRLTDLQAAIGLVQLGKLDAFIAERDSWARWYVKELADLPWLRTPHVPTGIDHAWQAFVAVVAPGAPIRRDDVIARLQRAGIGTRPGTQAVPELSYYAQQYGLESGEFPVASGLLRRSMAIPLHNCMTPEDYQYVVGILHEI